MEPVEGVFKQAVLHCTPTPLPWNHGSAVIQVSDLAKKDQNTTVVTVLVSDIFTLTCTVNGNKHVRTINVHESNVKECNVRQ